MVWLDTFINGAQPMLHLLNSVFIEGDAEPEISMQVMTICAACVFVLLNTPRLKPRQRVDARVSFDRLNQI